MNIFIGSDHAGFKTKQFILNNFNTKITSFKINFIDVGTNTEDKCDYPDYAIKLITLLKKQLPYKKTSEQKNFGILICGTGIGMCMVANRFKKIRAVACRSVEDAKISREHNNANVLCIGARTTDKSTIIEIIKTFIETKYEGGRHDIRINKF